MDPKLLICRDIHVQEYGSLPSVVASAPGKVGILGDYTEFAQGITLSAATNFRVWVSVSSRSDHIVKFFSREYNERKKAVATSMKYRKEDRWANLPKGVLAGFAALGVALTGLEVVICGDIPQSIGLGSSQALCLASAYAFNEFFQAGLTPEELTTLAFQAEHHFLGVSLGQGTGKTLTYALDHHLFWYDARRREGENLPFPESGWELAVINSRVPPSSSESVRAARQACNLCLKILNDGRNGKSLRDYSKSDLRDSVGTLPEAARRRSLHIIDELVRLQEASDCLRTKDMVSLGRLMHRSHESLRDLFEVSCPEIDWLVKRLQDLEGLAGARLTGEETGSSVLALGKPTAWAKFRPLAEEYERIFGFKAELTSFRPSSGARLDQPLNREISS